MTGSEHMLAGHPPSELRTRGNGTRGEKWARAEGAGHHHTQVFLKTSGLSDFLLGNISGSS